MLHLYKSSGCCINFIWFIVEKSSTRVGVEQSNALGNKAHTSEVLHRKWTSLCTSGSSEELRTHELQCEKLTVWNWIAL